MTRNDHSAHSSMVRYLKLNTALKLHSDEALKLAEADFFKLQSPHSGYLVQVSFSTYPARPDLVRIRSTNWRCEHEPHGIVTIEDARALYLQLLNAGFVKSPV